MENITFKQKLFDFLYHSRTGHSSIPQLSRIRISIIYLVGIFAAMTGLPFGVLYSSNSSWIIIISYLCSISLFILSALLFIVTRNIRISKLLMGIGFLVITIEEIIDLNTVPGLGPIVLLSIAPVFYLIFNFRIGIIIPVFITAGTALKLLFGPFTPDSIFNDTGYRITYMTIILIASIGSTIIVFSIDYLVKHLFKVAFLDQITGLANKNKLTEDIRAKCLTGKYYKKKFSIIGIEILNFNSLNSNLGSNNCDLILKETAKRLLQNSSSLTGRWSGSLFLTLIDTNQKTLVADYCKFLLESLSDFYSIKQGEVFVQFAAAVSTFPEDGLTIETHTENILSLLDNRTMVHGDIVHHDNIRVERKQQRFKITDELGRANLNKELELHYQPKMKISDDSCISAEALLRWNNKKLGSISPVDFIPAAEESGLIKKITRWVIKRAFNDIVKLQKEEPGCCENFLFSVNLSILDLKDRNFISFLNEQIKTTGCNPEKIEFEVTESIQADNDPQIIKNMSSLKELGFRIAIDDFGKGYSSLSYIHKIDAHNIKIDKSFIDQITDNSTQNSYPVVDAIISMGKSLGIEVTAEGVEEKEQLEYLRNQECDTVQGWIYAKAMEIKSLKSFLKENKYL